VDPTLAPALIGESEWGQHRTPALGDLKKLKMNSNLNEQ